MLESTVDRLGWPVARAGPVEVREHIGSSTFESPAKSGQLRQRCWHSHGEARDHCLHAGPSTHSIGVAVSAHDALVHPPRHIDLSVLLGSENCVESIDLLLCEQVRAGEQDAADAIERVPRTGRGVRVSPAGSADDTAPQHHRPEPRRGTDP